MRRVLGCLHVRAQPYTCLVGSFGSRLTCRRTSIRTLDQAPPKLTTSVRLSSRQGKQPYLFGAAFGHAVVSHDRLHGSGENVVRNTGYRFRQGPHDVPAVAIAAEPSVGPSPSSLSILRRSMRNSNVACSRYIHHPPSLGLPSHMGNHGFSF